MSMAIPALKKTGGLKKLAALKKQSSLTADQTCGTCEEMIQDFKALLTSPEGIQYWDDNLEWICYLLGMIDSDLESTCDLMVEEESSMVVDMIVAEIDEVEICSMFFTGC